MVVGLVPFSTGTLPSRQQWVKQLRSALCEMETMHPEAPPPEYQIVYFLNEFGKKKDLFLSCILHSLLVSLGLDSSGFLGDQLIQLYSKCGNLTKGYGIFCKNAHPTLYSWNAILNALVQLEAFEKALDVFNKMNLRDVEPDKFTFLAILKASRRLGQVRLLHGYVVERGIHADIVIGSTVVDMYSKLYEMEDAHRVFSTLKDKDVVIWNTMIGGFVHSGNHVSAFKLSEGMMQSGFSPNDITCCYLLKACVSLECPKTFKFLTHDMIIRRGLEAITSVANSIIDMYAKCGSLDNARKLFNALVCKDSVTWNAMIAGYMQSGNGWLALQLFGEMQGTKAKPDKYTFASSLQACGISKALDIGKLLHFLVLENGIEANLVVKRMLIDMYAKCGSMSDACKIFGDLQKNGDVVSWNSIIAGYAARGDSAAAVILFEKMQRHGVYPDDVTYSWALKAYTSEGEFKDGWILHDEIIRRGFESIKSIGSSLVELYATYGDPDDGRKVFDILPEKDLVLWNALIAAYAQAQRALPGLHSFERMQLQGVTPDNFTFSCVIKICGDVNERVRGRLVHHQILSDCECDLGTGNSLVDMYSKFGCMEESYAVFETLTRRDVITWNTVISGFAEQDQSHFVLELFGRMQEESIQPDEATYTHILKVCGSIGAGVEGRLVHDQVLRQGLEQCVDIKVNLQEGFDTFGGVQWDDCVPWNEKIVGHVPHEEAILQEVFNTFGSVRWDDPVPWNGKIVGHVPHEEPISHENGFDALSNFHTEGERSSYLAALKTCSTCGATAQGMFVHDRIIRDGCDLDIVVGSTLVNLYAKCGNIREARTLFDMLPNRDVAAWNAIIAGYTWQGDYLAAKNYLEAMRDHGLMPDVRTYCSVLAACGRVGKVKEGNKFLQSMEETHGVPPDCRHFTCMIDLLSREGKLGQAETLLKSSPFSPDVPEWRALLSACRAHGDRGLGSECYDEVVLAKPESSSGYVLMSSICADTDM